MSNPDVMLSDHGSIVLLKPLSEHAREWLDQNVQSDAQWLGDSLACERRYVQDLIDGLNDAGLVVTS